MQAIAFAIAILISVAAAAAHAQTGDAQSVIRLIVPYGPGGVPDVLGRLVAQRMSERLSRPVVVDNRPGGSGVIAAELVMRAAPDGNTMWIPDTGHLAINPALNPKLPYDPLRDFTPVAQMLYAPFYVFVQTSLGVNSMTELIAYAKARPGLNYGSSGIGSAHHLCMAQINRSGGMQLVHIPYKGVAQSIPALASGEISLMCTSPLPAGPIVKAGKAKMLAVASTRRSQLQPDTPSLAESGLPDIDAGASVGVMMPAGVARDVVRRMSAEIIAAVRSPEIAGRMTALGQELITRDPDQYAELIRDEHKRYAAIVKASGVRAE